MSESYRYVPPSEWCQCQPPAVDVAKLQAQLDLSHRQRGILETRLHEAESLYVRDVAKLRELEQRMRSEVARIAAYRERHKESHLIPSATVFGWVNELAALLPKETK